MFFFIISDQGDIVSFTKGWADHIQFLNVECKLKQVYEVLVAM